MFFHVQKEKKRFQKDIQTKTNLHRKMNSIYSVLAVLCCISSLALAGVQLNYKGCPSYEVISYAPSQLVSVNTT
jgi:hypothetical protein